MLRKRNIKIEPVISEGAEISANDDMLRIRRELVNEAIEIVGYDPVKIEQYVNQRHVA